MSEPKARQEPSMEEILSSIRRIISEDDEPGAEAKDEDAPTVEEPEQPDEEDGGNVLELTEVAEDGDDSVLELTEVVEDDGSVVQIDTGAEAEVEMAGVTMDDEPPEAEMAGVTMAEAPPEPQMAAVTMADEDEGLISAQTAAAATNVLSDLVRETEPGDNPNDIPMGGTHTLEQIVAAMLRPMLKKWLDENLPELTERLVRQEIRRLARRAEND